MHPSLYPRSTNHRRQLTLPPSFGSAYVGEAFSCTLCVNNELADTSDRIVTSIKIAAEMQTPSQTVPLELAPPGEDAAKVGLKPGTSLQKIVRFDLREEGSHVLAVSLSYSESIMSRQETSTASGGRVRSFRKLYQFNAMPCLSVRTKATDLPPFGADGKPGPRIPRSRYALEAQLENLADGLITLEGLTFDPKPPFVSTSLNWDISQAGFPDLEAPMLAPREITQVAFLIEEGREEGVPEKEVLKDGREVLGVLTLRWRNLMGDPGTLSTGWLTSKRR